MGCDICIEKKHVFIHEERPVGTAQRRIGRCYDSKEDLQGRVTSRNLNFAIGFQCLILGFPRDVPVDDPGMTTDRVDIDAARPTATRGILHLEVGGDQSREYRRSQIQCPFK